MCEGGKAGRNVESNKLYRWSNERVWKPSVFLWYADEHKPVR